MLFGHRFLIGVVFACYTLSSTGQAATERPPPGGGALVPVMIDQRGQPIVEPEPDPETPGLYWGLMMSCDTFSDPAIPLLRASEKDHNDLRRLFVDRGAGLFEPDRLISIQGAELTRESMLNALRMLADKADQNDTVVIYFAGHGIVDWSASQSEYDAYLATHETELNSLRATAVSMDEITQELTRCQARHVIFMMDACHSGAASNNTMKKGFQSRSVLSATARGAQSQPAAWAYQSFFSRHVGRHLLAASMATEQAFENKNNGLLTFFLLRALQGEADQDGDRLVTLDEAFQFIHTEMAAYTQNNGIKQTPIKFEAPATAHPALAQSIKGDPSTENRIRGRKVDALRRALLRSDAFDETLTNALESFCVTYPDDPYEPTARKEWHRQRFLACLAQIAPHATDFSDEAALRQWKRKALEVLATYERTFPDSLFLAEVRVRATEINRLKAAEPPADQRIHIPAGIFVMGRHSGGDIIEEPAYDVMLAAFDMGQTEVTNAAFARFLAAKGYDNQDFWSKEGWAWKTQQRITRPAFWDDPNLGWMRPDAPVVGVSWHEAQAYARFSGQGRLPTEAEWERSARGTDQREYPWGDDNWFNSLSGKSRANGKSEPDEDGYLYTAAVGAFPDDVSPSGCVDMAGNVAEWCMDHYDGSSYAASAGIPNPVCRNTRDARVIRGGAWSRPPWYFSATQRDWAAPTARLSYVGIRLVYPANPDHPLSKSDQPSTATTQKVQP